ncbi:hypothetical protein LZ906_017110 (plasmid) [Paraclostridium ghonii]|uniref:hypothetical protein n=1 Tax=Paraclostridium ghonii TaxID=29358 RepID=UPI00202CFDD1|nr:hypothetical protein [Paeniclostridium ghonii]MCM0165403.1 hypothetical protein [Paeniclostridium ghonii]
MNKLICAKCKKEIKAGDKILVELVMPNGFTMPCGRLDTILSKKSLSIHCKECSQ